MQVIFGIDKIIEPVQNSHIAIGVFDGLHIAHKEVILRMVEYAKANREPSVVITFEPHPRRILNNQVDPIGILTTLEEKIAILESWGIDYLLVLKSDEKLFNQAPEIFVLDLLVKQLKVKRVVVGYDYHFGAGRKGNAELISRLGQEYGFEVDIVPAIYFKGEVVKSSLIRRYLLNGEVELARELLGRPYTFKGRVVKGAGRGRKLGFPTANLELINPEKLIPKDGVYFVQNGNNYGMLNIGVRKTFGETERTIELHLLSEIKQELYGQILAVAFLERLRDEIYFPSIDALVEQLERDKSYCYQKIKQYKQEMEVTIDGVN